MGADVHVLAGHGDEFPSAQFLEAAEQSAHVGLVAGLAGAEHVTVDQDARGHGAGWSPGASAGPAPGAALRVRVQPVARERLGLGDAASRRYRVEEGGGTVHRELGSVRRGHVLPRGEAEVEAQFRLLAQHGDPLGHEQRVQRIDDERLAVELRKAGERLRRADHRQAPGHRLERLVLGAAAVGQRRQDDVGAAVQRVQVGRVGDDGDAGAGGLAQPLRRVQAGDDERERHALGA